MKTLVPLGDVAKFNSACGHVAQERGVSWPDQTGTPCGKMAAFRYTNGEHTWLLCRPHSKLKRYQPTPQEESV